MTWTRRFRMMGLSAGAGAGLVALCPLFGLWGVPGVIFSPLMTDWRIFAIGLITVPLGYAVEGLLIEDRPRFLQELLVLAGFVWGACLSAVLIMGVLIWT